ncbi:MAG TPA: AraC family transcriptional regulator [Steroidobacteraceae bacterium]|jgi:AraC-like DNA-binding protein
MMQTGRNGRLRSASDLSRGKTTLGNWIKAICRAAEALGCDREALLAAAGLTPKSLENPTARCPLNQSLKLWRVAMAATGDPAFGLKVASQIKHTTFHALSYGIAASSTLKEAFERIQRYCHLATDAVEYRFQRSGDEYQLEVDPIAELPHETVDAIVGIYLRMCRSLIGREFSPLRIEFRRPRPARIEDFNSMLRAPMVFDAAATRIAFDCESMERPLDSGNPELARHNDAIALEYLSQLERGNVETRVREVLRHRLARGEPSQEEVAELMNMSARTLQRKLADADTTYIEVLNETRRTLAFAYLSAPHHTVSDVTFLLGFSAASCFTRAFRRWTGQSPTAWRRSAGAPRATLPVLQASMRVGQLTP